MNLTTAQVVDELLGGPTPGLPRSAGNLVDQLFNQNFTNLSSNVARRGLLSPQNIGGVLASSRERTAARLFPFIVQNLLAGQAAAFEPTRLALGLGQGGTGRSSASSFGFNIGIGGSGQAPATGFGTA